MGNLAVKQVITFIPSGDKVGDFETALRFYQEIGFTINFQAPGFAIFVKDSGKFFLQQYPNQWIHGNLMMVLEVENLDDWWTMLTSLELEKKFTGVKLTAPKTYPWGVREAHLVDVCGVFWKIS